STLPSHAQLQPPHVHTPSLHDALPISFRFTTVKPGRVPGPGATLQAPHLVVALFMRGMLKHLATRIYFPDEPSNAEDPLLKLVRSEEHTSELQSRFDLVCRLLLEPKRE